MKYLKLKQSVINTYDKYHFTDVKWCNRKFKFSKYRAIYQLTLHDNMLENYRKLFKKYLNNDIEIIWEK